MQMAHWQGEATSVWEAVWGVPRVEAWTTVPSTNDRARELARAGAPAWSVVVADHQSAGRGRAGHRWHSPPGSGLLTSVLLRPAVPAYAGLVPLLVGVALAKAIERLHPAGGLVGLKWPNDLWVGGGKCCGILCEGAGDAVVVGVGVNLRGASRGGRVPGAPYEVASLEDATGRAWSPSALLGAFLRELRQVATILPPRFQGAPAADWARRDLLAGRRVEVGGVEGVAAGVGPDGALQVRRTDGTITAVRAGHVTWSPPPRPSR